MSEPKEGLREGFTTHAPIEAWGRTKEECEANFARKLAKHRATCPECIAEQARLKEETK
mgnify:CR=1 FL=1